MMLYVMIVIKWTISVVNTIGTEFGMLNRNASNSEPTNGTFKSFKITPIPK